MAPYRFPLQQVLEYRTQVEEQAKLTYAQAQQRYQRQVGRVEALRQTLAEQETKLYQAKEMGTIWLLRNFVLGLTTDLAEAETVLLQLAQALNRERQNLVKRSQERKLLDKLKENQAQKHAQKEHSAEQRQFDETATLRYRPQTL